MKRHILIWFDSGSVSVYSVNKCWASLIAASWDMHRHGRWDTRTVGTCLKSSMAWAGVSAVPATDRALSAWGVRWGAMGLLEGGWGTEAALTGWWPGPLGPAVRGGLGRLAAVPWGQHSSSSLATAAGSSLGSALGSEISTEPSTLALLWGRRGLAVAAAWVLEVSAAGASAANAASFGLSFCVWLWLEVSWSIPQEFCNKEDNRDQSTDGTKRLLPLINGHPQNESTFSWWVMRLGESFMTITCLCYTKQMNTAEHTREKTTIITFLF